MGDSYISQTVFWVFMGYNFFISEYLLSLPTKYQESLLKIIFFQHRKLIITDTIDSTELFCNVLNQLLTTVFETCHSDKDM
jgi:hypothetical protein